MRFYYTTGSTFENDELPQRLGAFTTFHAAQSAARQLLMSEPSGVIYLYVPASNCNAAAPLEFTGWRGRYCLVRIVTSLAPRRKGTPFLFGTMEEQGLRVYAEQNGARFDKEKELDRVSLHVTQDVRASFSLA